MQVQNDVKRCKQATLAYTYVKLVNQPESKTLVNYTNLTALALSSILPCTLRSTPFSTSLIYKGYAMGRKTKHWVRVGGNAKLYAFFRNSVQVLNCNDFKLPRHTSKVRSDSELLTVDLHVTKLLRKNARQS